MLLPYATPLPFIPDPPKNNGPPVIALVQLIPSALHWTSNLLAVLKERPTATQLLNPHSTRFALWPKPPETARTNDAVVILLVL